FHQVWFSPSPLAGEGWGGGDSATPSPLAGEGWGGGDFFTAVQGEVLAHQPDGDGLTGREVLAARDRLPEAPQVTARQRAGAGVLEVGVLDLSHRSPSRGC